MQRFVSGDEKLSYRCLVWLRNFTLLLCRARAIEIRQQNQEAVGGFFSQIGSLYTVHHLWGKHISISSVLNGSTFICLFF